MKLKLWVRAYAPYNIAAMVSWRLSRCNRVHWGVRLLRNLWVHAVAHQHAQHAQPTALVHVAPQAPTHGDNVFGSPVPVAASVAAGGDPQRHPFSCGCCDAGRRGGASQWGFVR